VKVDGLQIVKMLQELPNLEMEKQALLSAQDQFHITEQRIEDLRNINHTLEKIMVFSKLYLKYLEDGVTMENTLSELIGELQFEENGGVLVSQLKDTLRETSSMNNVRLEQFKSIILTSIRKIKAEIKAMLEKHKELLVVREEFDAAERRHLGAIKMTPKGEKDYNDAKTSFEKRV